MFSVIHLPIPLVGDLDESFKKFKVLLANLKNSWEPILTMFYTKVAFSFVPYSQYLVKFISNKSSIVFSNVPGNKEALRFIGGKLSKKLIFFVPSMMSVGVGISLITHLDTMKLGVITDESCLEDPNELLGLLSENLNKALETK